MHPQSKRESTYSQVILEVFRRRRAGSSDSVPFPRTDLSEIAAELGLQLPKNLGDVIYSFRFRRELPDEIRRTAPEGREWVIRLAGDGQYRFDLTRLGQVKPNAQFQQIKIPDATPGIIERYALTDEQALLAKVRYNRLLDIFTGVACYSLQSHLRTKVKDLGQCEIDELYVGIARTGTQFVFPVQAKGGNDKLGAVQIEQDLAVCRAKFPDLPARAIGAQFLDGSVVMFEFVEDGSDVRIARECHYRLVPPADISRDDLLSYRHMITDQSM